MSKKNIFIGLFACILVGTAYIQYRNTSPQKKTVVENLVLVKQSVVIGDKKTTNSQQIKLGTTALQLLRSKHTVQTKGEGKNAFITAIGGRAASEGKREFWALYVNGKQATVGAGSYYLKNSDTIEWKIETY